MLLETPYEITLDISKNFRALRRAKKMTMKEVSQRSGVPYSSVCRFEHTGEVSLLALVKMASVLDEDEQMASLFANRVPTSIEEIIRENRR